MYSEKKTGKTVEEAREAALEALKERLWRECWREEIVLVVRSEKVQKVGETYEVEIKI